MFDEDEMGGASSVHGVNSEIPSTWPIVWLQPQDSVQTGAAVCTDLFCVSSVIIAEHWLLLNFTLLRHLYLLHKGFQIYVMCMDIQF
jgi:hypothetical protein